MVGRVIRRLLIANRGEIARRVIRACRELGIESVAVYSEADEGAPHAREADRALPIGAAPAVESYLRIDRILEAARAAGVDAVHPGYGFLAENADFAAACEAAGLAFVGPPAAVIAEMGSKIASRRVAVEAGLPVVPGQAPASQDRASLLSTARDLGLPLLVKASAGGGGKGMRVVREAQELDEAIDAAKHEAASAFGDETLYMERLLEHPRHVEIQVFGDGSGAAVSLFERDCSVQRRHQKIIEESPSPALAPALRQRMADAGVSLARHIRYSGAGTVEFLVEGSGNDARFYFLEMNTRLQVEHPVTEAVTGVDLVRAQLAVAAGRGLPWQQEALGSRGHAIECRVYAEDPEADFLPQAGRLAVYREPSAPGIRIDSGVVEGQEISVYYDPLLAKLIAAGEDREAARRRALAALKRFAILGIRTNIPFLVRVLESDRFREGGVDTAFLDHEGEALRRPASSRALGAALAAAAAYTPGSPTTAAPPAGASRGAREAAAEWDPWQRLRNWRA